MRKYLAAMRSAFKIKAAYRFDIAMQVLSGMARVLFAWLLWGAVFAGRKEMAGFTMDAMLTYYLLQSFFAQLDNTGTIADELSRQIRGGTFSKLLVLPVRVQGYLTAQALGSAAYSLAFSIGAGAVCLLAFPFRPVLTGTLTDILAAAALILLGRMFFSRFHFFLGILTFRFQDIWMFLMIKSNLAAFLTGGLIPLALLPGGFLTVLKLTPFYPAAYLPVMLLMGRGGGEALLGIAVLAAWTVLFSLLNPWTYARLRRRYDGVGI